MLIFGNNLIGDYMTDIIKILFTSSFSVIAMFLMTKLMGKKQISQLNLFDYVNGITIGSIAAEMATSLEQDFWLPLTAMVVYTAFSLIISLFERRSVKFNKFFVGTSDVLLNNGVLYEKNLIKAKLSITEFLCQCRTNGYFNISDIETAILEPNGLISFLPKSGVRPATPDDMNLTLPKADVQNNVIIDGRVMRENLKGVGYDEVWLINELQKQGINSAARVFLATCTSDGVLSAYLKVPVKNTEEPFI